MSIKNIIQSNYESISLEGGMFPAEFLEKVRKQELENQSEADYGLLRALKMRDELGRYFRIALGLWEDRHTPGQAWLESLLREVLGFTSLEKSATLTIAERSFPLSHRALGGIVPILLTDAELDKSHAQFGSEGHQRSPSGLIQEYLNATKHCMWGLVCNGRQLRLLRDNPSLTRPAYVEVDLERMFGEQQYADFCLVWLLIHQSRFAIHDANPETCALEQWRKQSLQTGERISKLRTGVTETMRLLGNGFLAHPANQDLLKKLGDGSLTPQAYYLQLLRMVYRFIFLTTTEDRDTLLLPGTTEAVRELYMRGYSMSILRERASRRKQHDTHRDNWQGLLRTFTFLAKGEARLGLPALGGFFGANQCPDLDTAQISNDHLLPAVFQMTFFNNKHSLSRINYRDMGTEEFGSVYESLLELVPKLSVSCKPWTFGFVDVSKGNARKLSGSYYTPPSLVEVLLKSTLEPVIESVRKKKPEDLRQALLNLKVVDPSCGSGHFLLAAARRIAVEVARCEAGHQQPTREQYRHALREVIGSCIYGVDLNPLSVELCRMALWLESVEPGKPLGFLEAHIRCGNSLVGIHDPILLKEGIPDEAYTALSGDDSEVCKSLKKQNRLAQEELFTPQMLHSTGSAPGISIANMTEESLAEVEKKRNAWESWQHSADYWQSRLAEDLFTAAFFAPKSKSTLNHVPLSVDLIRIRNSHDPRPGVAEFSRELACKFRFFHWRIEFPEVFTNRNGFDCVLGNPPWERIKIQEKEFFSNRLAPIAEAPNSVARSALIAGLKNSKHSFERELFVDFQTAQREAEATSLFARKSGRYPKSGTGDVNLYAIFAEFFGELIGADGRSGVIVPTGIASDDSTKAFFDAISSANRLVSLYDFENREKLFAAVHSRMKFCCLSLGHNVKQADFAFFLTQAGQLSDERRHFTLSGSELALLNPNTHTCPLFRSQWDAELTKKIYRRVPVLKLEGQGNRGNPWGIEFQRMLDMSNDSDKFRTRAQLLEMGAISVGPNWILAEEAKTTTFVPLYEAKMVHQYDHRWATYEEDGESSRDCTLKEKQDPGYFVKPRYWVEQSEVWAKTGRDRKWLLGWRDITNSTNSRTVIASIIPVVGVGHTMPIIANLGDNSAMNMTLINANLVTIIFDFIARQKVGGTHLTYHLIKQLPILPPATYTDSVKSFILPRALRLLCTDYSMLPLAQEVLGTEAARAIQPQWNPAERAQLRAELDAYYAKLYGLTRDELRYILDPADVEGPEYPSETFRGLKNNETKEFGEYRTQRLVLEAWDKLERGELA